MVFLNTIPLLWCYTRRPGFSQGGLGAPPDSFWAGCRCPVLDGRLFQHYEEILKLMVFQKTHDLIRYTLAQTMGPGTGAEAPEQFWAENRKRVSFQNPI